MFPIHAGEYNKPSFKPLPEGLYKVKITRPKEIKNKQETAKGINVTYSVTEGLFLGRIIFDSFYIEHPAKNFEENEINRLNGLMNSSKIKTLFTVFDLDGKLLTVKIKIKKASSDGRFPEKNEVVDYYPYNYSEGDSERPSNNVETTEYDDINF